MTSRSTLSRILLLLAVGCLVLGAGQAQAGDGPWYVAARVGDANVEAQLGSQFPKRIDDEDQAVALDVGYSVNRYLSVELGYRDLGRHGGSGVACRQDDPTCPDRLALCVEGFDCNVQPDSLEATVDGVSLALVPIWPVGERLSLRGKAGLIAWDTDVAVERGFLVTSVSRTTAEGELFSGRDLLVGLGLQYDLASGLGLLLQHETFDLDARTTSLGVSWRF